MEYINYEYESKINVGIKKLVWTVYWNNYGFFGGIDSALVLFLSRKYLGWKGTIGVISNSESLKDKDYQLAIDFAKKNDIQLETVYTKELSDPNYNSNPSNRCYFCKKHFR